MHSYFPIITLCVGEPSVWLGAGFIDGGNQSVFQVKSSQHLCLEQVVASQNSIQNANDLMLLVNLAHWKDTANYKTLKNPNDFFIVSNIKRESNTWPISERNGNNWASCSMLETFRLLHTYMAGLTKQTEIKGTDLGGKQSRRNTSRQRKQQTIKKWKSISIYPMPESKTQSQFQKELLWDTSERSIAPYRR